MLRLGTNKGLALDDLGKYEEAIQAYNRSIDLKPGLAEAWSNKGNALNSPRQIFRGHPGL